jgi:hypothetical protein
MYKRHEKKQAWLLDQNKTCHTAQLVSQEGPVTAGRKHRAA